MDSFTGVDEGLQKMSKRRTQLSLMIEIGITQGSEGDRGPTG